MVDTVTRHELDLAMRRLRDEFRKALAGVDTGEAGAAVSVARAAEAAAGTATEATIAMDKRIGPTLDALGAAKDSVDTALAVLQDTVAKAVASLRGDVSSVRGKASRAEERADEVEKALHRVNGEWTEAAAGRADALTRYVDDEIRKVREAMAEAV